MLVWKCKAGIQLGLFRVSLEWTHQSTPPPLSFVKQEVRSKDPWDLILITSVEMSVKFPLRQRGKDTYLLTYKLMTNTKQSCWETGLVFLALNEYIVISM